MPDLRVDVIGEVNRVRALRQVNDIAARRKDKDLVGEHVQLQCLEEFLRIVILLLEADHLTQPRHLLIVLIRCADAAPRLLVFPMRSNTELGDLVHRLCADLDLERVTVRHDGGVQGLIAVRLRHGDVVLEPAGNRLPHRVDDPEHTVAVLNGGDEDTHRREIVDLIHTLVVALHLAVDAVEMLRTPLDLRLDAGSLQFLVDLPNRLPYERLPLLPLVLDLLDERIVCLGFEVAQTEILELHLDTGNAEPVRERCVDLDGLLRNAAALVLTHAFQRAHIVEAVCKLYHDDADILRHCEEHLAVVFELDILLGHILDASELRHAVDELHDVLAELRIHLLQRRAGILHDIVQERCADCLVVEVKPREDVGDVEGVDDVGLPRDAHLSAMCFLRIGIRLLDLCQIGVRLIGAHLFQYHIDGDSSLCIIRHLSITLSFRMPTKSRRIREFHFPCRWDKLPAALRPWSQQSELTENTQGQFHRIARNMKLFA